MVALWWILAAVTVACAVVGVVVWHPWRAAKREKMLARARREFHRQREQLEARFLTRRALAASRAACVGRTAISTTTSPTHGIVAAGGCRPSSRSRSASMRSRGAAWKTTKTWETCGPRRLCSNTTRFAGAPTAAYFQSEPDRSGSVLPGEPGTGRPGTGRLALACAAGRGARCRLRILTAGPLGIPAGVDLNPLVSVIVDQDLIVFDGQSGLDVHR